MGAKVILFSKPSLLFVRGRLIRFIAVEVRETVEREVREEDRRRQGGEGVLKLGQVPHCRVAEEAVVTFKRHAVDRDKRDALDYFQLNWFRLER